MPKKISELDSAELKFRALLNKRDDINEQATALRSERDSLNDQRKALQQQLRDARDLRDAAVAEMRVYKARRDELQRRAKELIALKQAKKGAPTGDLRFEIRAAEGELRSMELTQQTVPMKIPEERVLLEKIKARAADVAKLKKTLDEQDKVHKEVRNVDHSIDGLFKRADTEHEEVVRFSKESQKHHDEVMALSKEIVALADAADKKHLAFIKLREDADAVHVKALELRGKVIDMRNERRTERTEERNAVRDVNVSARRALDDKDRKEKVVEDTLQKLLKGGKIQIG
jgi:uncharacterized coiled-coil DUF342 family protein